MELSAQKSLVLLLLCVSITIPIVHSATSIECVDSLVHFENYGWKSSGSFEYSDFETSVPSLNAPGIFVVEGPTSNQIFYRQLSLNEPLQTTFAYIKYFGDVQGTDYHQMFVYPSNTTNLMTRLNDTVSTWGEAVVQLSGEAISVGLQVEIGISNFQESENFFIDRIAVWNGNFVNGTTNVAQEIEANCRWGEDVEQPSTTASTTSTTTTTTTDGPTQNTTTTSTTTTSTIRPPTSNFTVECVDNDADFWLFDWKSQPAHSYAETSANFPFSDEAAGIFYFQGDEIRLRRIYKTFTFTNYEQPTYLYLKYYSHINSNNSQFTAVFPTTDATLLTVLDHTKDFKWGESLLELYSEALDGREMEIAVSNFQFLDFFILDKVAVGHGVLDEGLNAEEEIKSQCSW